ncbi:MAG: hypothetical protein AAF639_11990 [Chloroflexota bacterium]
MRWLETCVQLNQLLQEEIDRNPLNAISEVQAHILLIHGRKQNKLMSILMWLSRYHNSHDVYGIHADLGSLIEENLQAFFDKDVIELPDPIGCPFMSLHAIPDNGSYRLEPDMPYRRGVMPCHIVDFLQEHREQLQALEPALRRDYPKIADACQRVLINPADAQGNTCKILGDVIISLQTPADAVLWTTDASFDVICPVLGIEHRREPLK